MAQNKEQLDKLLDFISAIIKEPGNEEFTKKLKALVSSKNDVNASVASKVEQYLGLDFKIDSTMPLVDYSFVHTDYVKNRLISDYREMLRYRFGVRSHETNFDEFCRFAALQIEGLLFYYYKTAFNNLNDVKADINHWNKYSVKDCKSIAEISLAAKITAYSSKFGFAKDDNDTLFKIKEMRNEQSHRGNGEEENAFIIRMEKNLEQFPLYSTGKINFGELKKSPDKYNLFKNMYQDEYNRYDMLLWKRSLPFAQIMSTINNLAVSVKNNLSK